MFSSWHLSSSDTQKIFQILCRLKLKAQELLTNVSAIDPKVRLQMATSVCVSNFTLIRCRLKLKAQEILQTCRLYRPRSPTSNSNECFCVRRLRIDQTLIKIESSRNITNVSAIDPKVRLQMATERLCVRLQIDQMSIVIILKFKEAVKSVLRIISEHNKVCKMSKCMIEIEPHSEEQ